MEKTEYAKRYNVTGVISGLQVREDKNGNPWASFRLVREGKRAVSCAAFGERATNLTEKYQDGSEVKLFGYFEPQSFVGSEGTEVKFNRFTVLWSGDPKKTGAEADQATETAEAVAA
jgi:hypothetical protein